MENIKESLEYVTLGRSGIKVSRFSYGNWVNSKEDSSAQETANTLVKAAFDAGINYFDTAEAYDAGKGERQMGIALKALNVPRSDYVVSTKIFWGKFPDNTNGHNNYGTSRKRLQEGLNRSLQNLQMDYVDVVFCHRYDHETPTIEVVQTMKDIIASGKALYWGTSTWPGIRVMEAMLLCDIVGCPRPIAEQCQYSMMVRDTIEKEYTALFDDYGLGTTIWSPLCSGILTGKYNDGIPEGSRFAKAKQYIGIYNRYFGEGKKEATLKTLRSLGEIAGRLECSMAQLALAWTLVTRDTTTCLLGCSSVKQLHENLASLDVVPKLTPEVLEEIETALDNRPEAQLNYKTWVPLPARR